MDTIKDIYPFNNRFYLANLNDLILIMKGRIMILKDKDSSVEVVGGINQDIKISTKWTGNIDFDTAALQFRKDGIKKIVYFGTEGDGETHGYLNKEPFVMLDKDSLSGGEENLVVSKRAIDSCKKIYLVVWDYKAIKGQAEPKFNSSDVMVHIGDHADVHPVVTSNTNFIVMACIQNDDGKISIVNKSIEGHLIDVDDDQMWNIIEKAEKAEK